MTSSQTGEQRRPQTTNHEIDRDVENFKKARRSEFENSGEEILDVDSISPRKTTSSGIKNDHPTHAQGWQNKLEKEDSYINKLK